MQPHLSAGRVPVAMYRELEQWMIQNDSDAVEMLRWCMTDRRPSSAEDLAHEIDAHATVVKAPGHERFTLADFGVQKIDTLLAKIESALEASDAELVG